MRISILFIPLLGLAAASCQKRVEATLEIDTTDPDRIYLSGEIRGDQIKFLWDTGCGYSALTKETADRCGLEPAIKKERVNILAYLKEVEIQRTRATRLKIGTLQTASRFGVFDELPAPAEGIIGADIIKRFCWDFDFVKGVVQVSNRPADPESTPALTLRTRSGLPYVDIEIDEIQLDSMVVDTGMPGGIASYEDATLAFDFCLPCLPSNKDLIDRFKQKYQQMTFHFHYADASGTGAESKTTTGAMLDSVAVNGLQLDKSFLKIEDHPFYETLGYRSYLSLNFLRRFSRMRYNPLDDTIFLYIDTTDTRRYTGKQIDEFFDRLSREYQAKSNGKQ